jgi:hypothetical protein
MLFDLNAALLAVPTNFTVCEASHTAHDPGMVILFRGRILVQILG